jgi:hypothetical protein
VARFEIVTTAYGTGVWNGVQFREEIRNGSHVGVATVDDASTAAWFAERGFIVTPPAQAERAPLPADFPGRDALARAGFRFLDQLEGLTETNLLEVPGVGRATARRILEAL